MMETLNEATQRPFQLPHRMRATQLMFSDQIMWASFCCTVCRYCQIRFRWRAVINETLIAIYRLTWSGFFHWLIHKLMRAPNIWCHYKLHVVPLVTPL